MFFGPKLSSSSAESSVDFHLEADDLIAFFDYERKRSPQLAPQPGAGSRNKKQASAREIFYILVVLGISAVMLLASPEGLKVFQRILVQFFGVLVGCVVVVVLLLVNQALFPRQRLRKLYADSVRLRRSPQRRLSISQEGVLVQTAFEYSIVSWRGILSVERSERLICFFVDVRDALIVPLRAFSDEAALENFLTLACRYHDRHGPSSTEFASFAPT